jgi:putative transposase
MLTPRVGPLVLHVPQGCAGSFNMTLFARDQRSEQALILALMEMVFNGVATRKVATITEELGGTCFSQSTVSQLCMAWMRVSRTGMVSCSAPRPLPV